MIPTDIQLFSKACLSHASKYQLLKTWSQSSNVSSRLAIQGNSVSCSKIEWSVCQEANVGWTLAEESPFHYQALPPDKRITPS